MLKSLWFGQREDGGLQSLTWWGFWSAFPTHGGLSDCVSFSSVCLKPAGRKVTTSWSQQVCWCNGGWLAPIANIQTSFLCMHKKKKKKSDVKLLIWRLGAWRRFGECTPRIPGISRVFQSYMFWDLETPKSREEQIRMTALSGRRKERQKEKKMI